MSSRFILTLLAGLLIAGFLAGFFIVFSGWWPLHAFLTAENIDTPAKELFLGFKEKITEAAWVTGVATLFVLFLFFVFCRQHGRSLRLLRQYIRDMSSEETPFFPHHLGIRDLRKIAEEAIGLHKKILSFQHRLVRQFEKADSSTSRYAQSLAGLMDLLERQTEVLGGSLEEARGQESRAWEILEEDFSSTRTLLEEKTRHLQSVSHTIEALTGRAEDIQHLAQKNLKTMAKFRRLSSETELNLEDSGGSVSRLRRLSENIEDLLSSIRKIADRTHLLSLNATIEASRAGDAGKGFAVVAAEIKSLSSQTAAATDNIDSLVSEIRTVATKTEESLKKMEAIFELSRNDLTVSLSLDEEIQALNHVFMGFFDMQREIRSLSETQETFRGLLGKKHTQSQRLKHFYEARHTYLMESLKAFKGLNDIGQFYVSEGVFGAPENLSLSISASYGKEVVRVFTIGAEGAWVSKLSDFMLGEKVIVEVPSVGTFRGKVVLLPSQKIWIAFTDITFRQILFLYHYHIDPCLLRGDQLVSLQEITEKFLMEKRKTWIEESFPKNRSHMRNIGQKVQASLVDLLEPSFPRKTVDILAEKPEEKPEEESAVKTKEAEVLQIVQEAEAPPPSHKHILLDALSEAKP